MASWPTPSPSPMGSGNSWYDKMGSGTKIPKVTSKVPKATTTDYFSGLDLRGVANTLNNAPTPVKPDWAKNLEANLKANPNMISDALWSKLGKGNGQGNQVTTGTPGALNLYSLYQKSGNVDQPQPNGSGGGGVASPNPNDLYVDPRQAYQPVLDYLAQQDQAVRDRYATNEANIKNIFSSLTSLTAADSARITQQFTDSLAASKADLAARTAESRAGAAAGVEQAVETGTELGGGDAMVVNPLAVAAQEGIDRSNAYATTWQNLQGVNKMQTLADISSRGAGYGQQEIAAVNQLNRDLQDRLLEIGGNTAQVKSDIAQAKFDQKKNIAQIKFQMKQAAAAASSKGATGLAGIQESLGQEGYTNLVNSAKAAHDKAWDDLNPTSAATGMPISTTTRAPKAKDVMAAWIAMNTSSSQLLPQANKYINTLY